MPKGRGAPVSVSARGLPGSARGTSDSLVRPRRLSEQQTTADALIEDATGTGNSEPVAVVDSPDMMEELGDASMGDDGAVADNDMVAEIENRTEPDGVQNREALAAAMEAERRQLAEMFDEIDAESSSAALEAAALANVGGEAEELEKDVEQLKQSIARIRSPGKNKVSIATVDGVGGANAGTTLPSRLASSRSAKGINGVKGTRGLNDSFNFGQATHGVDAIGSGGGGGTRGGLQVQQGRTAKQRLNSIKSKQGGVSNMPPMFGMRPKSKAAAAKGGNGASNRSRRAVGRRGESGLSTRDSLNNMASLDDLRSSHDSNENSGASCSTNGDAAGPRRVALKQLKGDSTRRGGLPPGARVHQVGKPGRGGAPQVRSRVSRSRSDNFAFPIST